MAGEATASSSEKARQQFIWFIEQNQQKEPFKFRDFLSFLKILSAIVFGSAVLTLAVWIVGYAVDSNNHNNKVVRNATLVFPGIAYPDGQYPAGSTELAAGGATKEIGGMSRDDLMAYLSGIAEEHASRPVRIDLGSEAGAIETTFGELGLGIDIDRTFSEAMRLGRIGGFFERAAKWAGSSLQHHKAQVHYDTQPDPNSPFFDELEDIIIDPPVDAQLLPRGYQNSFQFSPGETGRIICASDIPSRVLRAANAFASEIAVDEIPSRALPARTFNNEIAAQVDFLNQATSEGLGVASANRSVNFSAAEVRSWLRADYQISGSSASSCAELPSNFSGNSAADPAGAFTLFVSLQNPQSLHSLFEEALKDDIIPGTSARSIVWNGQEVAMDVTPGSRCCAPFDPDSILHILFGAVNPDTARTDAGSDARNSPPGIQMQMRVDPELVPANSATGDIKHTVAEFTTYYEPDTPEAPQSRVVNIQRFADLMKEVVIQPGATFSLNEHVGRRTRDNGFVVSQMLTSRGLVSAVGGGVSQFATTFFNAAFFAGLEFKEYQMHTYYFDRYPYGREATISFGDIDLVVINVTPYEILVWPTYTDDSVTVTFFSTKWVDTWQSDQVELVSEPCTRVRTERTRVFPDGQTAIDRFTAFYRPRLRMHCEDNPLIRPLRCAGNEQAIDTNGNLWPDWCRPCPEGQIPDRTVERRQKCYSPEAGSAWAIDPETASPEELLVSLPT